MIENLDEGFRYDADGVKMNKCRIVEFFRTQRNCADDQKKLIDFLTNIVERCLIVLTKRSVLCQQFIYKTGDSSIFIVRAHLE
jgi:hypothetical protein